MFKFLTHIHVNSQDTKAVYDMIVHLTPSALYIAASCFKSMGLHKLLQQAVIIPRLVLLLCLVYPFYLSGTLNLNIVLGQDWFNYQWLMEHS